MSDLMPKRFGQAKRLIETLLRHPTEIRYLREHLSSRGQNALQRRVPWLPFAATEYLEHVANGATVFEYGGGGSTLWFCERAARVVTVEHSDSWYSSILGAVRGRANVGVLHRTSGASGAHGYSSAIDSFADGYFDIVLIDGQDRVGCAAHAARKVKPGGILVLDDTDRPEYAPIRLQLADWRPRDFAGLVPCKDRPGYTTIFIRPRDHGSQPAD